ncbi:MAG: extracellular solute-binding protein [Butyrivibrio sp.]|nr:extracellular solute-binding protein [Butyrivibrio sp.]
MSFKKIIKKITCGILVTVLSVSAVTGCGKKEDKKNQKADNVAVLKDAQSIDVEYVFKQEDLEGIIEEDDEIRHLDYVGDKVRVVSLSKDGKLKCISFNKDGSDVQSFDIPINGNDIYAGYVSDKDGNLYIQYEVYKGEGDKTLRSAPEECERTESYLAKYDSTGKELVKVDVLEEYKDFEERYIGSMCWIDGYGIVMHSPRGIETYSEESGFNVVVDEKSLQDIYDYPCDLYAGSNGLLFVNGHEEEKGYTLRSFDLNNKKFSEPSTAFDSTCLYHFFEGVGYDIYTSDYDGIYGYNSQKDKLTKILDFEDSDIVAIDSFSSLAFLSDTEIYAYYYDSDNGDKIFARFTKVTPADVANKTVITVGGLCIDENIRKAARKFNKANDKYKIKLADYGELYAYDDDISYEEALNQFNLDILAGNVPDILCFSYYSDENVYIDKGLLLDLAPAFDKGGALGDIEILPNLFDMMHTDDKIYSVFTSFQVDTVVMRERFAEGKNSITFKECDDLIKENNTDYKLAFGFFDKEFLLERAFIQGGNKFVDMHNKKCNFNSPDFIDLLKFANNFPTEIDYSVSEGSGIEFYADDRSIFDFETIDGFYDYARKKQAVFNDEIAFVGFPNNSGENEACIFPDNHMGVYSKTKYPDVAYEFIKTVFEESDQEFERANDFPSDKAMFEKMMQLSMDASALEGVELYTDEDTLKAEPLSKEDTQKLYDYILSVKTLYKNEQKVRNIVVEEASAFFSGQKTAEEVAEIIQSRVSTYLNEIG